MMDKECVNGTTSEGLTCDNNPSFLIGNHANNTPDKIAVIDYVDNEERILSYGKLEERISALTGRLFKAGIKPGSYIAILSKNRVEILEIFIASMRLGATPFCLNSGQSSEHIEYVLNESKPGCIFFEPSLTQRVINIVNQAAYAVKVVIGKFNADIETNTDIETYDDCLSARHVFCAARGGFNDTPKMITYTSGSTGNPKGVQRQFSLNDDVIGLMTSMHVMGIKVYNSLFEVEQDPLIVTAPLFHGIVLSSLIHLCLGKKVVIMRYFDPPDFIRLLDKHKVIVANILSPMLALCIKEKQLINKLPLPHLKLISIGGAPSTPETIKEAEDLFNCKVQIAYGLTEGSPHFTFEGVAAEKIPINSVGRSPGNDRVKLIDVSGNESDFGELWFKNTLFFFQHYHNKKEATENKFNNGWFMTGDIFYRDPGGFYYFQGRKDDMFVCDGENIYPLEVENILCKQEAVLQACVVSVDNAVSGKVPVAMIVCKPGHSVTKEQLRQHYIKNGPLYAYPRQIVFSDALPLSGPGKIDRKKVKAILTNEHLQETSGSKDSDDSHSRKENIDISTCIIEVLGNILKNDGVTLSDNVFDLGLTSLQATIFIEKIRERVGVDIVLEIVFELELLHRISEYIDQSAITENESANLTVS